MPRHTLDGFPLHVTGDRLIIFLYPGFPTEYVVGTDAARLEALAHRAARTTWAAFDHWWAQCGRQTEEGW